MPFTFSHPAVILPLTRSRYLSATGLFAGSIIPDFEYFIRLESVSNHSHTIAGAFYFDLPLALLVSILFHVLVKKSLIDNLPYFFRARFQGLRNFDFVAYLRRYWFNFLIAALIGTATHILWDDLTHAHTVSVNNIDWLQQTLRFGEIDKPIYKYLLHGSTIAGLLVVFFYIALMRKEVVVMGKPSAAYWMIVTAISSAIFWLRVLEGYSARLQMYVVSNIMVTIVSAFLFGVLTTSTLYAIFKRPQEA